MKPIKVSLVSGSPKPLSSSSEALLESLRIKLSSHFLVNLFNLNKTSMPEESLASIMESDILVLSFPLYVDGIPSHLLNCLFEMEKHLKRYAGTDMTVYAIVNCGFFEGQQALPALEMVKNWCVKAGVSWGQGLGVGGGGMIQNLASVPDGQGPKKNFSMALDQLASNINAGSEGENLYISPNFPKIGYKIGAEMGWRHQIKMNGLSKRDLNRRLV
jgi:multimeric flavodoxin WrbA